MLEMRRFCECGGRNLPPHSDKAMICSFECTFCADGVENTSRGVCPRCGGDFTPRPARAAKFWLKIRFQEASENYRTANLKI